MEEILDKLDAIGCNRKKLSSTIVGEEYATEVGRFFLLLRRSDLCTNILFQENDYILKIHIFIHK